MLFVAIDLHSPDLNQSCGEILASMPGYGYTADDGWSQPPQGVLLVSLPTLLPILASCRWPSPPLTISISTSPNYLFQPEEMSIFMKSKTYGFCSLDGIRDCGSVCLR